MDPLLLAVPFIIGVSAILMLAATWGANALAHRTARWHATRPRFTSEERERLRALREHYRHDPDQH